MVSRILEAYRAGVVSDDLEIVDVHGHLCGWPPFNTPAPTSESLIEVMDTLGIRSVWLAAFEALTSDTIAGNRFAAAECERHRGRFFGYAAVNPNTATDMRSELEEALAFRDMIGVKVHPTIHRIPIDSPKLVPAWEVADDAELPVLVHTSGGSAIAGPSLLVDVARRFGRAKFILGHSGGSMEGIFESIETAKAAPNIFLDTMGSRRHFRGIEHMVDELGSERVCFGTDMYGHDAAAQLGKVVYARISDDEKRSILGGTARELLETAD